MPACLSRRRVLTLPATILQAAADAISPNGFRTVMEIDTLGTFAASRAAFPALKASGNAAIINITATLQYGATWWQVKLPSMTDCQYCCGLYDKMT